MRDRSLPAKIEVHRDNSWNRDPELRIQTVLEAERFVERLGFCGALTDSRRPGPSLFIAVCGRRDAHAPRNVQKDPEMNLSWTLKDEMLRRGRIYYGKQTGNRSVFISQRQLPYFFRLFGWSREEEQSRLSLPAKKILKALRKEWELSTGELRAASSVTDRVTFNRALDELQRTFKVLPSDVIYSPKFTYIWTLTEARFPTQLKTKVTADKALLEIARAYLSGAGMTVRGELARVTGLSNSNAGLGNWGLVDEGFAVRMAPGVYCLESLQHSLDSEVSAAAAH